MGTTAAEKSFKERIKIASAPMGYVYDLGGSWDVLGDEGEILVRHWGRGVDLKGYERAFNLYGAYLELVGGDAPVEQHISFTWPPTKELEFVGHGEPTKVEEQTALLDGTAHASAADLGVQMGHPGGHYG